MEYRVRDIIKDDVIRVDFYLGFRVAPRINLMFKKVVQDMVKRGDMMSIEDVIEILAIDLIGAVPDDDNIVISTNQGEPCVGNDSLAGQAYMNICRRVLGEEVEMLDLNAREGFFKKLSKLFK